MKVASCKRLLEPDVKGTPKTKRGRLKKLNLEDRYPPMKCLIDDHITLSKQKTKRQLLKEKWHDWTLEHCKEKMKKLCKQYKDVVDHHDETGC